MTQECLIVRDLSLGYNGQPACCRCPVLEPADSDDVPFGHPAGAIYFASAISGIRGLMTTRRSQPSHHIA